MRILIFRWCWRSCHWWFAPQKGEEGEEGKYKGTTNPPFRPPPKTTTITKMTTEAVVAPQTRQTKASPPSSWRGERPLRRRKLPISSPLLCRASTQFQSQYKVGATVILVAAGLYYIGIEQIIDDSVKEILHGEFAGLATVGARQSTKDTSE